MNAEQLLDLLEKRGLLEPAMVKNLRRQVEDSAGRIPPERVLRLLVEKGLLTEFQAKRLLREVATKKKSAQAEETPKPASPPQAAKEKKQTDDDELGLAPAHDAELGLKPSAEDDELGLVATPEEEADVARKARTKQAAETRPKPAAPAAKTPAAPAKQPTQKESPAAKPKSAPRDAGGAAAPTTAPAAKTGPAKAEPEPSVPDPLSDGLADLLGDEPMEGEDLAAGTALLPTKKKKAGLSSLFGMFRRPKGGKKTKAGTWDSPLILMGGATLIVLVLLGIVLLVFLRGGSGDQAFQEAQASYADEKYSTAVDQYDKFLSRYSSHASVSLARVRRGLAQIRMAMKSGAGSERALSEAQRILPTIVGEDSFDQAYNELAGILPAIAKGFADQAKATTDIEEARKRLGLTEEALKLVNNPDYLPTSAREGVQQSIVSIGETVDEVESLLERDRRLRETVAGIETAVSQGATDEAYRLRNELLTQHPTLARDEQLEAVVLSITERMGEKVQVGPPDAVAAVEERPEPSGQTIVMAATEGEPATGLDNRVLYLLTDGAVYGVRAQDGRVVWRRFVGYHPGTRVRPLGDESGADAILLDGTHQELQRLAAADGSVMWRLPLGGPAFEIRRTAQHLVVTQEQGRILLVDPDSGKPALQAVLPQGISTAVGLLDDQSALLAIGDHSNIYILAADTLECRDVIYLGHQPDCVRVSPTACLGHLLVFDNAGVDFARLHVLGPNEEGDGWQIAQKAQRISHNILVDPLQTGPHVICLTDHGGIHVFEVNPAGSDEPVREVAKTPGVTQDIVAGSMVHENGHLWVADVRLTRYRLNLALGQIERVWVDHQGDTFLTWLYQANRYVFYARRLRDTPGVTVAALQIGGGADRAITPQWTTDLAVPPAGPPVADAANQRLLCVSARGDAFAVDAAAMQSGQCTQTIFRAGTMLPPLAANQSALLNDGRWAFTSPNGPPRWLLFDPTSQAVPLRLVPVANQTATMTAMPVAFAGKVLVALENGQVHLVDQATGQKAADPFQPPLNPGMKYNWRRPCILGDDRQFVIADSEGSLHRVAYESAGTGALKVQASGRAAGSVESPLACLGRSIFMVVRKGNDDVLTAVNPQDFQTTAEVKVAGRVTMGPETVGQMVVVASDAEGLVAIKESGERLWSLPLSGAIPAGPPVPIDGDYCLVTQDGTVRRFAADGNLVAERNSGEPLVTGPVVQGSKLLVAGIGGTLRLLAVPE